VINGEKSAFNNSVFGKRRKRTIEAILTSMYNTYENKESVKSSKTGGGSSGLGDAITDALTTANMGSKRKEEIRKAEFLRIGQVSCQVFFFKPYAKKTINLNLTSISRASNCKQSSKVTLQLVN
jgi:hypothetical protein